MRIFRTTHHDAAMPCCKNRLERGIFQRNATRVSARCQTRFAENNV
jgi:hypothetical protein